MKKLASLLMVVFVFFACSGEEKVVNDLLFEEYKIGDKITLQSVNGGEKTFIRTDKGFVLENEDKVVMFDFFGTFCAPCKEEAPHLTALWKKNEKDFILVGLTHFEEVDDEVVKEFASSYGAYYFLSNSKENARIIAQILKDINYQNMEALPFKVVSKNGEYQVLSDYWNKGLKTNFYLGKIPTDLMQHDLDLIFGKNHAKN